MGKVLKKLLLFVIYLGCVFFWAVSISTALSTPVSLMVSIPMMWGLLMIITSVFTSLIED